MSLSAKVIGLELETLRLVDENSKLKKQLREVSSKLEAIEDKAFSSLYLKLTTEPTIDVISEAKQLLRIMETYK